MSGPDAGRIRTALLAAARGMSTLDVQTARLHTVVQPYPAVRALQVSTQFPHGLRIHVVEQLPAAVLTAAGQRLVISTDGTVLRDMRPPPGLPLIPVRALPVGPRVAAQAQLQELAVLMGAPSRLRSRIATLDDTSAHGVIVRLRQGPRLYFGGPGMVRAKWVAAAVVLASRGAAGAVYIDLSDPQRPAAG